MTEGRGGAQRGGGKAAGRKAVKSSQQRRRRGEESQGAARGSRDRGYGCSHLMTSNAAIKAILG